MSGAFCSDFMWGDYEQGDKVRLCQCPSCGGFLPRDFNTTEGTQWQCKNCGTVLETIKNPPEDYEVEAHIDWYTHNMGILYSLGLEQIPDCPPSEEYFSGKICVVPDYAVKMRVVDYAALRKFRPPRKHLTGIKVFGYTLTGSIWIRAVWKDRDGSFINIDGKRIEYDSEEWKEIIKGTIPSKEQEQ
jgi:hypothetical protein